MSEFAANGPPSANFLGKRERSKAANREAILCSARRVFAQMGFEAATVRDIIRGTDLAAGTFYNYFRSKEEVFEALADDQAQRFLPFLKQARTQAHSLEDYLGSALRAYFGFLAMENEAFDRPLEERRPHTRTDTPGMQEVHEEVRGGLCDAIERGLAPPIDADFLASACIGLAKEVGETMISRRPFDIEAATQFALSFILKGVRGPALAA